MSSRNKYSHNSFNNNDDHDREVDHHNYDSDSDSSVDSYDSNVEYERDAVSRHHSRRAKDKHDGDDDDDDRDHDRDHDAHYSTQRDTRRDNAYRNRKQMEARKNFLNMSKKQTISAIEVGCNIKNIYWPSHRWLYWKFMSTKRLADALHEERDRLFYDQINLPKFTTSTSSAADSNSSSSSSNSNADTISAHDQYDYKIESLSRRIRKLEQIEHSAAAILCEFYRYSSSVVPCYSRCLLQSENGEYAYGHILIDIRSELHESSSSSSDDDDDDDHDDRDRDHDDHHHENDDGDDEGDQTDHQHDHTDVGDDTDNHDHTDVGDDGDDSDNENDTEVEP